MLRPVHANAGNVLGCVAAPIRRTQRRNLRYSHASPSIRRLQGAVTGKIKKALPPWIWKPVYRPIQAVLFATGVVQTGRDPLAELPNAAENAAFVREFHAADIHLFRKLDATRRARAEAGGAG